MGRSWQATDSCLWASLTDIIPRSYQMQSSGKRCLRPYCNLLHCKWSSTDITCPGERENVQGKQANFSFSLLSVSISSYRIELVPQLTPFVPTLSAWEATRKSKVVSCNKMTEKMDVYPYHIYSAIRRVTKSVLWNFAIIRVLPLLNNPKDLDPSCKMDLDFWDCFGMKKRKKKKKKTASHNRRNMVYLKSTRNIKEVEKQVTYHISTTLNTINVLLKYLDTLK